MPNYQDSKIYKIVSFSTDDVYIGSTCEKYLSNRLGGHRKAYNSYLNGKHNYVTSFKLLETDDYDIVLIENYPCNNKQELHSRERYWIENTENCVNKCVPNRTLKEYREDNKDKFKRYREDNKDKIKRYHDQYYEDNKDKIHAHQNQKHKCIECGGKYTNAGKVQHIKTSKHQNCYIVKIKRHLDNDLKQLNEDIEFVKNL